MAEEGSGGSGGEGGSSPPPSQQTGQTPADETASLLLEKNLEFLREEIGLLKKREELLTNAAEKIKVQRELKQLNIKLALREQEIRFQNNEIDERALEAEQQKAAVQLRQLEVAEATMGAFDQMFATTLGMSAELSMFGVLLEDPAGFAEGMVDSFSKILKSGAIVSATFEKILESSTALAYETDQAFVNFQKTTGQVDRFSGEFQQVNDELNQYGVTIDSLTGAQAALMKGSIAFNQATTQQQVALAGTVAQLDHMGVSTENSANNIRLMTDVLGMSTDQAGNNIAMLKNLADELPSISADDLAASFSGAGDTIAKFGEEGMDVFRDLARAADASGIAIERLISITERFDYFSGAADQVGKLNAILGGPFLNSMKLMQVTDPTERMRMLSDAVNDAGLSFDEMGYYQKIALKEALGLENMTELAKVMAGKFGDAGKEVNKTSAELLKSAEEAKKYTTATQELEETMREFAVTAQPVIEFFKWFLQGVQSANQATGGFLIPTLTILGAVIYGLVGIMKIANTAQAFFNMLSEMSIGLKIKEFIQSKLSISSKVSETAAQEGLNKSKQKSNDIMNKGAPATKNMGAAAGGAAKNMMALGLAILMIGAGIGLAAYGLSFLVASFKDLGDAAPWAVLGIVAFTAAFGLMIALLIGLVAGPQAAVTAGAVGVLLSVGGAALMIGAGMGLAAAGIGYMVSSFAELLKVVSIENVTALALGFQLLTASLATLALVGPYALLGVGATFLGIGAALASVDTAKAASLGQIFSGLEGISNGNLANLQAALDLVEAIKETVNSLDSDAKVIKLQRVIDSINMTAQGKPVGATAGAGGGTASGTTVQKIYVQIPFKRFEELIGEVVDGKFKEIDKG